MVWRIWYQWSIMPSIRSECVDEEVQGQWVVCTVSIKNCIQSVS